MARMRMLKPGFFINENLAELPPLVRLLFAGLWTIADRAGRLEDRPKRIKAALLPWDDLDADQALDQLANSQERFVIRYEANGKRYIQISNFAAHQHPHVREPPSELPPPPAKYRPGIPSTGPAPDEHHAEHQPSRAESESESLTESDQPPIAPRKSPGGQIGTILDLKAEERPVLNGNGAHEPHLPNGTVTLTRVEHPRLRKRKRPETLAQSTKYELEQQVDERSRALARALEHEPMTETQALAYANTRWPTGPPNERVVALAFEAYAMRAGAAPGGTS